jgi:cytochrome b
MERSRILVWDLPVRAFHWLLVAAFAGAFLTPESERLRGVHALLGYVVFGLLAFRVVWGVIGSRYARFASFAFGPRAVLAYVRSLLSREPVRHVGHNPAGSYAIFALIALGLVAATTGHAIDGETSGRWLEALHEGAANAMLAVVIVHVAGVIVASLLHRENLVAAMVTGYKAGDPSASIHRHDG